MKKFIDTLKNIWKIEDLRQRILITVLFVAIYRFGSKVLLPGISYNQLDDLRKQTANGLMSLLDMFSGGALHLSFYRHAAACRRRALLPEDAARG